jgi:hypothetical protein
MRLRQAIALSIVFALPHAAQALELELASRAAGSVHVAVDERFGAGFQPQLVAGALVQLLGRCGLGGGLATALEAAQPSPAHDLVSYRGYSGIRVWGFAVWRAESARWPVSPGIRVGLVGSFLRYTHTAIYLVSPGVLLEPFVRLGVGGLSWLSMEIAMPLVVTRRADLCFSGEAGLAVSIALRAGGGGTR